MSMQCYKELKVRIASAAATELIRDDQGRITHIKAFLYDTGLNKNGAAITEAAGDISAPGFIGLPFIVTPNLDHDVFMDKPGLDMPPGGIFTLSRPVSEYRSASESFTVGRIVDVQKNVIASASNRVPIWSALIKLTNDRFIDDLTALANQFQDIKKAKLYVSSFFVGTPRITAAANGDSRLLYDGPVTAIHLALVKSPAFNDDRALISGLCSGDDYTCSVKLANAASYEDINKDQLVIDFNNQLSNIAKMLYASASSNNSNNMSDNKDEKQEAKDNTALNQVTKDKESKTETETKEDSNKLILELKSQVEQLTKQINQQKEPEKPEPKEDDTKEQNEEIAKLKQKVDQLEKEKAINAYLEKLKVIPNLDIKTAKKQAEIFVDKNYNNKEVDEFINSFAPVLKASASSNKDVNERKLDASMLNTYIASASNYDPDTASDDQKKTRYSTINKEAIDFILPFIK